MQMILSLINLTMRCCFVSLDQSLEHFDFILSQIVSWDLLFRCSYLELHERKLHKFRSSFCLEKIIL
jgi:hypothetical protein